MKINRENLAIFIKVKQIDEETIKQDNLNCNDEKIFKGMNIILDSLARSFDITDEEIENANIDKTIFEDMEDEGE